MKTQILVTDQLAAAILAPSGDNVQPWRFEVEDAGRRIAIHVDEARDRSPMNAGQRMARIAVGAAAENLVVAAKHHGTEVAVSIPNSSGVALHCAAGGTLPWEAPPVLAQRVSNRRIYRGDSLSSSELLRVERAITKSDAARLVWVCERPQVLAVAKIIGQGDALMFGMSAVRRAFVANVRFDRPPAEEVDVGLSLSSLELARGERVALKGLGMIPESVFRFLRMGRTFRKKAENLIASASGICFVVAEQGSEGRDFDVGRLMQRVWLELTASDYAVQPMMSLPVLDNMATACEPAIAADAAAAKRLCLEAAETCGLAANERIAAVLRFGKAPPPSGRTGRRPLDAVLKLST